MNRELINELFTKFELAKSVIEDTESWSARELQKHLGYSEWRNFVNVIDKAKTSCQNAGGVVVDHFVDINKMVDLGSGAQRPVDDIALSRYACYLIAQNGDPEKNEIAFAQTYFAVQTRKQEVIGPEYPWPFPRSICFTNS
jgi:DNA-damage-inducible protein D